MEEKSGRDDARLAELRAPKGVRNRHPCTVDQEAGKLENWEGPASGNRRPHQHHFPLLDCSPPAAWSSLNKAAARSNKSIWASVESAAF